MLAAEACDAEVEYVGVPAARSTLDEDVRRLEVAVDEAALVGGVDGPGDIRGDPDLLAHVHAQPGLHQAGAMEELHGDVGVATDLADLVDATHVIVVDLGLGPRLAPKSFDHLRIAMAQELERHVALEGAVPSTVDRSHAAPPDQLQELVVLPRSDRRIVGEVEWWRRAGSRRRHSRDDGVCAGRGHGRVFGHRRSRPFA